MKERDDLDGTYIERDVEDMPYTMIPNDLLADTSISWKAKGMISYLLGKPRNWKARTKDIERHGNGGTHEIITAMRELRAAGYARLIRYTERGRAVRFAFRVANRKKYTEDNGKRVDIAIDDDNSKMDNSDVEIPQVENPKMESPYLENQHSTKKEGKKKDRTKKENKKCRSSSNKERRAFGDGGAADVEVTPSAITSPGPRSSAEKFIQDYRSWAKAARIGSVTVVPDERKALQEFFTDNPDTTTRELIAIMLAAWMVPVGRKVDGTGYNPFWHCNEKSKRIASFMKYLPKLQEEVEWDAEKIDRVYRAAEQRFLQAKAA